MPKQVGAVAEIAVKMENITQGNFRKTVVLRTYAVAQLDETLALQAEKSRIRFPMGSIRFVIQAALSPRDGPTL